MNRWTAYASLILTGLFAIVLAACGGSKFGTEGRARIAPVQPPPQSSAQNYNGKTFNSEQALEGMGEWVEIGDERYFVPASAEYDQEGDGWQPYQHGYWSYDEDKDWTWVSHEPWGWVTDHYGIWRHHNSYGWVWLPFEDNHYEPHTVTWFDEGDYIGWYPYHSGMPAIYRYGAEYGFDDGYWGGVTAVLSMNGAQSQFVMGFTLVGRTDIITSNIRKVLVRDRSLVFNYAYRAHQHDRIGRVGRYPGGHRMHSFQFVQRYARNQAPRGRATYVKSQGGATILQPYRTHAVPNEYRKEALRRRDRRDGDRHDRNDRNDRREDTRRDDSRGSQQSSRTSPASRSQSDSRRQADSRRQEQRDQRDRQTKPRAEDTSRRTERGMAPQVVTHKQETKVPTPTPSPRREEKREDKSETSRAQTPAGGATVVQKKEDRLQSEQKPESRAEKSPADKEKEQKERREGRAG